MAVLVGLELLMCRGGICRRRGQRLGFSGIWTLDFEPRKADLGRAFYPMQGTPVLLMAFIYDHSVLVVTGGP